MKNVSHKETFVITVILSALLLLSFYDVFFLGKTFKVSTARPQALASGPYGQENNIPDFTPAHNIESAYMEEPIYEFIRTSLKKGILPLWNPHQACGYPLVGWMHVGIFFPLNLILYLLPSMYSWDILILLRILLAGVFAYWMMRLWKFENTPSLATAIVFMLTGPMLLLQYWTVNTEMLTPLVLISLEYLIRKPNKRNVCFVAAIVLLTFLGGHAEHIFLVNIYGFIYFCFRLLTINPKPDYKRAIFALTGAYTLGIMLSSIVLFPFLQNFTAEFWHNHSPHAGLETAWEPRSWMISLATPLIFSKQMTSHDFIYSEWWGGYIGLIPLGLAILGIFNKRADKFNIFWGIVAFVILGKSFGLPGLNWIGHLPLFKQVLFYMHTPHLIAFTIAILAGIGLQSILDNDTNFKKALIFSGAFIVIFVLYYFFFPETGPLTISVKGLLLAIGTLVIFPLVLWIRNKNILKLKHLAFLFVGILFLELFLYIHRGRVNRYDSYARTPYIEFLRKTDQRARSYGVFWTFYPNTATGYGIDGFGIADPLLTKRIVKFINHFIAPNYFEKKYGGRSSIEVTPFPFFENAQPFLDLLNVRYTVAPGQLPPKILPYLKKVNIRKPIYSNEVNIFSRPTALPRAFIVHRAVFEPDEKKLLDKIRRLSHTLRTVIVIHDENNPDILNKLNRIPSTDRSSADIVSYTPNEVIIKTDMDNPGFLVLSDTYHPGWKAFINNSPTKIYITDYLIRSVFLPKGEHLVRFVFKPLSFYLGMWVSLAGLIIWVGLYFTARKETP